ncbi:MAG: hypothetical protein HC882_10060 [Acidobacteria bacterium]|nr:hypothetical protein [Acidobacteriota bacterium]
MHTVFTDLDAIETAKQQMLTQHLVVHQERLKMCCGSAAKMQEDMNKIERRMGIEAESKKAAEQARERENVLALAVALSPAQKAAATRRSRKVVAS